MPKRELSKCRVWEKERRERLKTCFDALSKLLPSYDPSITPSKLEILQRAASHITDLQQKNKQLLIGDQKNASIAQRDEVRRLREKCRKLSIRSEQLCTLLKTAGIKIPKEYLSRTQNGPTVSQNVFKGPPKMWSGRISKEKADILKKQHDIDIKSTKDSAPKIRKRKRISSPKKSENIPPKKQNPQSKNSPQNIKKLPKKQNFSSENLASKVAPILGPGTLILANGSVVPVPPTTGTLHRIQIVPTVPQNAPQNSIILMPQQNVNNNKNSNIKSKLPALRPKNGHGIPRNALPIKVGIPPLPKRKVLTKKLTKIGQKTTLEKQKELTSKNDDQNRDNPPENGPKSIPNSSIDSPPKNLAQEGQNLGPILPQNDKEIVDENPQILAANSAILDKNKDNSGDKNNEDGQNIRAGQNLAENLDENLSKLDENPDKNESKITESIDNLGPLEPEMPTLKQQNPPSDTNNLLCDPQTGNTALGGHEDHSELSNDIFATLGGNSGVIGGQHTESMSPTAAFLLAFPLVSTLTGSRGDPPNNLTGGGSLINNNGGNNNNDRNDQTNDDDRQSTPTTLLQIGGNMNLDKNRTLLQIGDTLKNRFSEINDENIKKCDSKFENYNFYKDFPPNSAPQNMYPQTRHPPEDFRVTNNTNQIEKNPQNAPQNSENKEPLISSVLQVSHACLYEQKNINQPGNNFYPYIPEVPPNNPPYCPPKDKKSRHKVQNTRAPVNWMTSPDIRTGYQPNEGGPTGGTSGMTSDYFLPSFSDVYSGISNAITSEIHQNVNNNNADFSWTSGGNRGVLPTLIGDLALGVTVGNTSAPINGGIYTNTNTKTNITTNNFSYNYEHTNLGGKENSGGFLSVSSMLVEGTKPRKTHQQSGQHKRREKTKHKNEFLDQKKYSGGYSAEELIGDTQYPPNPNIPNFPLNDQFYQHKHQNPPNQPIQPHQNPQNSQNHQKTTQAYQQRHQGGTYPTNFPPNHGEFSALLSAAVVDSYSKTFDSFVHTKPPSTSYDTSTYHRSHQTVTSDSDRRRHRSPRAPPAVPRDPLGPTATNPVAANTTSGFSELSFLSMTGAVNSPVLQDEFHSSTPFLNAPPTLPTPVASSLTNFNLSAIFPEINKGATPSGPPASTAAPVWGPTKGPVSSSRQMRYQNQQNSHQNASKNHISSYIPQQGSSGQTGPHEALYGGPGAAHTFLHDGNGAPTNFSFSFGAP